MYHHRDLCPFVSRGLFTVSIFKQKDLFHEALQLIHRESSSLVLQLMDLLDTTFSLVGNKSCVLTISQSKPRALAMTKSVPQVPLHYLVSKNMKPKIQNRKCFIL